jgi:hypothetical protein
VAKPRQNPRPQTPNTDPDLGPSSLPQQSLAEVLGGTVDELRQLYTDFGLRPYRVFSVVIRWTGGDIGKGDAVLESEVELLPTPLLVDMKPVRGTAKPAGLDEEGAVMLKQISPRYTEDDVRTIFHQEQLPKDRDGYLEIRMDARDGITTRRRFTVKGAPSRSADRFEWSTRLIMQDHDRDRDGQIRDDVRAPEVVQMHRFDQE